MTTLHSIELEVRSMLAEERKALEQASQQLRERRPSRVTPVEDQPCPATWVLSSLIDRVIECPSRAIAELEPVIRCRVRENCFVSETGDCCASEEDYDEMIETQVKVVHRVLERLRKRLLTD